MRNNRPLNIRQSGFVAALGGGFGHRALILTTPAGGTGKIADSRCYRPAVFMGISVPRRYGW